MAGKSPAGADEILRQVPGFYDHSKVRAYQSCIVELAKCGDVNLLEMMVALRNVLLATETQLANKAGDLRVPESIRRIVEESEGVADEVAGVPAPEGNRPEEDPGERPEGTSREEAEGKSEEGLEGKPEEKSETSEAGKSSAKSPGKRARKSPASPGRKPRRKSGGKSEGAPEGERQ